MQRTDLNISPYNDDYDQSKNFHRILFRPRTVQARELNQLQSILQNQIERVGSHLFEEGAMVVPGGITTFPSQDTITMTFVGGSAMTDVTNRTEKLYIVSNASGLLAEVSKVIPSINTDPHTLFVTYINSGSAQQKTFSNGEALKIFYYGSDNVTQNIVATVNVGTVSNSVWVKVKEGIYFVRGMLVKTSSQDVVVSKYITNPSAKIGFLVNEEIITEDQDDSLFSNAIGTVNYKAPGASRLKITLTLAMSDLNAVNADFIELVRYENGVLQKRVDSTDYSVLDKTLAQRMYETNGDFTVNKFDIDIKEHLNTGSNGGVYLDVDGGNAAKVVVSVRPGNGYVKGYRVENIGLINIPVDKARDTAFLNNSVTAADYGNYILCTTVASLPDIDIKKQIQLLDSGNTQIGYCNIRAIRKDGSNYRFYIFNLNMNASKTLNNVAKLKYTDASSLFTATLVSTSMYDSSKNSLVFKLPVDAVKSLYLNGSSDISYTVMRSFNVTTNASGTAVIAVGANEVFSPVNTYEYFVAMTGAASAGTVYDPSLITLTGAPVGSTATIALGAGVANTPIKVIAPVIKQQPVQRTKTLTTVTSEAITFTAQSTRPLSKADIQSIVSIIDTSTSTDITSMFKMFNGQKDNWYEVGTISTIDGSSITKNLLVTYKYFSHSPGDYFSADSYGSLDRSLIPFYNNYNLADTLDFRPLKDSSGNFTSSTVYGEIIKPGDAARADITYYLPRWDIICVDKDGNFFDVKGVPALKPTVPATPTDSMKLYELYVPSYTTLASDIQVGFVENKRYTMRDIGKLEDRIANVEYYTTLSTLENKVNTTQVLDSVTGNARFKNGFAVDGFSDLGISDYTYPGYNGSLDLDNGYFQPRFIENGLDVASTSSVVDTTKSASVYTKGFSDAVSIKQPYATRTININPYAVFTWVGDLKLTPATDIWSDVKYLTPIVVNASSAANAAAMIRAVGGVVSTVTNRTSSSNVITTTTTSVGSVDSLISTSVIPYMRTIDITFNLKGMRPGTRLYPFWDSTKIDSYCKPPLGNFGDSLITDANGSLTGVYRVPNTSAQSFRTGTSTFRFTDSSTDSRIEGDSTTSAQTQFVSAGTAITRQVTNIVGVSTSRFVMPRGGGKDPIAQTFVVSEDGGAYYTKCDVYFATKAVNIPVTLEIRSTYVGLPTDEVITRKVLMPSSVITSTDASIATTFTFDDPIYLEEGKEYAMVLLADTQEYNVYIAQLGEKIINSSQALAKQPNIGVFLTSSNGSTWNPNQLQDLKFTLYKAAFATTDSSIVYNMSAPIYVPLGFNPIKTTSGSNQITYTLESHGLKAGDQVTVAGAVTGNGVTDTQMNITSTVLSSTIDTFTVSISSNATATGTIGGSGITVQANYPFSRMIANIVQFAPINTSVVWEYSYKQQSGRAFTSWTAFDINTLNKMSSEGVIDVVGDLMIRATLKSSNVNLSPTIQADGIQVALQSARVNTDSSNPVMSYITQNITFNKPSTSARFYVAARLPTTATMKLYYKPILSVDEDIASKSWVEITPVNPIVNDLNNFIEFEYQLSGIGSFVGYKVRIDCLSSDAINYPQLTDFRSIGLA